MIVRNKTAMAKIVELRGNQADRALGLHAALARLIAEARSLELRSTASGIAAAADCLLLEAALTTDRPADRESLLAMRYRGRHASGLTGLP